MTCWRLRLAALGFSLIWIAACSPTGARPGQMEDHFHWREASTAAALGWVVFLPGAGGLSVLDDDQHYFRVAELLNKHGLDVLIVDYKPAYQSASNPPDGEGPERIAWVTEQAVDWMRRSHPRTVGRQGALVGWSLGASGATRIVNDPAAVIRLGLHGAVMFYPLAIDTTGLNNRVPLLILTGDLDDVSPAGEIRRLVSERSAEWASVDLVVYPGAYHGFVVDSLKQRRTIRLLPLFGPSATLQYDETAARDATHRLIRFLVRARATNQTTVQAARIR